MKVIILAAGYATRLYPLTEHFPKALLEVGGKPILDWLLEDLDALPGVTEHVVVSNHKYAAHFQDWARTRTYTRPVTVLDDGTSSNETRLGAVGDLLFAADALACQEDLLVAAGDNIVDFSFAPFVDFYRQKAAPCIMYYQEPDLAALQKCGVATVAPDGLVLAMEEKPARPKTHMAVPPFYLYPAAALPLIRKGAAALPMDAPGSLVEWLCQQTPVYAMEMPGRRYDVGDLAAYEAICANFPLDKS